MKTGTEEASVSRDQVALRATELHFQFGFGCCSVNREKIVTEIRDVLYLMEFQCPWFTIDGDIEDYLPSPLTEELFVLLVGCANGVGGLWDEVMK